MTDVVDHFAGCLLGVMIGDSLGSRLEGFEHAVVLHRYPARADLLALTPARYTCVSEMTAAVAASLAEHPRFDGEDMARRLADGFDETRGYGQGTTVAIARLREGVAWNEAGLAESGRGCFGNAAAARSVPVGLLGAEDAEWIRWVAEEAASITHQHALGSEGATLVALAVALVLGRQGRPLAPDRFLARLAAETQVREFRSRLETATKMLGRDSSVADIIGRLGNNMTALGSVVTALFCFADNATSFEDAVIAALRLGGNTSTLAALAGALAGAMHGREALPAHWVDALERGPVSRERLEDLARRMASHRR